MEARPLLRRERGTVSTLVPAGNGHMNSKTMPVAGERKDKLKEKVPTRYRNCIFIFNGFGLPSIFIKNQIYQKKIFIIKILFWPFFGSPYI